MEKKTPYNPNNKTELPLNHYLERFRAGEPEEMSARTGAAFLAALERAFPQPSSFEKA